MNNSGHGIQSWLNSGQAHNISVVIERYHVVGASANTRSGGFVFGRLHPPGGSIVVRDSTATNTGFNGIYVWDELLDNNGPGWDFHLIFENVTLRDTATAVGRLSPYTNQAGFVPQVYAPIGLDSLATYGDSGLLLNGVTVYDTVRRPFLQACAKWGPHSVAGDVKVHKKVMQPMPGCDINASQTFPDLKVHCDIVQEPARATLPAKTDDGARAGFSSDCGACSVGGPRCNARHVDASCWWVTGSSARYDSLYN